MINIGIIGAGTVGSSVIKILKQNKDIIQARAGKSLIIKTAVVKNINKKRDFEDLFITDDVDKVLNDKDIDIVVELMGGVDDAFEVVKKALKNGKAVITANKAMLAYHRYELQDIAGKLAFEYEAAVAGGIPIITALRDGLTANHILSIKGIMNGTTNYMLDAMINDGINYKDILKKAQDLGYAEADPSFDVGGTDAAHKLLILASIAYGIDAKPEDILIEGIENIALEDIKFAKEFDYTIKLLAIANKVENKVELRVHPVLISNKKMIAKIDGVMNGISVVGDKVGETLYYGAGAGGDATASAVIANIVDIARQGKASPMLGFDKPLEQNLKLVKKGDIRTKYYIRFCVANQTGVLNSISEILSKKGISIETMLQNQKDKNRANLSLSIYECCEKDINEALDKIRELEFVDENISKIRIEV
ncbi:MAG: homoserine dehydrogenase [Campylobacteraceae bacterium 4484_166]|nr:MAG: homoserine dehydrogenase [Campylobacteraceae bacterium 4484_166]